MLVGNNMAKQLSEICINVEDTNDNFVGVKYDKKDIQIIFPLGYRIPEDNKEKIEAIKLLFKTIKLSHDKKIDYEIKVIIYFSFFTLYSCHLMLSLLRLVQLAMN